MRHVIPGHCLPEGTEPQWPEFAFFHGSLSDRVFHGFTVCVQFRESEGRLGSLLELASLSFSVMTKAEEVKGRNCDLSRQAVWSPEAGGF